MQRSNDDGVVLLIGSGRRAYRQYLIAGLASRAPLWLIDEEPATWQAGYLAGSSVVGLLDPARIVPDEPGLIDAAASVARQRPVLGVCTYDEGFVIAAAVVAERLGLPGLTAAGAVRCRDKHLTRMALTADPGSRGSGCLSSLAEPAPITGTTPAAANCCENIRMVPSLKPLNTKGVSIGLRRLA